MVEEVLPVHDVESWIWFKSRRLEAKVRGVTRSTSSNLRLEPCLGRALTEMDGLERRRVCVVRAASCSPRPSYVGDPLKLDLKVGSDYFRVVGVLPDFEFQSPNKAVPGHRRPRPRGLRALRDRRRPLRPDANSQRRAAASRARTSSCTRSCARWTNEENVLATAARGIQTILGKLPRQEGLRGHVPLELLESRQRTQRVFNIVLPIIAGISLLVGGIGILNIMLASVVERTREIGIRRAIGATSMDITWQFLVETVTLASLGGLLGIVVGVGAVWLIDSLTDWTPTLTPWAVALSLVVSCATGIVFGLYPAMRAARMDPIEALRHD